MNALILPLADAQAGLTGGALGYVLISQAYVFTTLLLALAFFALALALVGPPLNAHLSRKAGEQQGAVMGAAAAAASLGRIGGPLLAGYLYEINWEYPWWSGAAMLALGEALAALPLRQKTTNPA
ncbi:MAG: MFS transporter [Chloroflexi bacterium]|nr:MFS transporter [Chloroflexota bacterium]